MSKTILLVGTHHGVGLSSVVSGFYHALDRLGVKVGYFKPVLQYHDKSNIDHRHALMARYSRGEALSLTPQEVQKSFEAHSFDELMEDLIHRYENAKGDADVVIMEGLFEDKLMPYAMEVNQSVARALDADIIVVANAQGGDLERLDDQIDYLVKGFGGYSRRQILGAIVNAVAPDLSREALQNLPCFQNKYFSLLACVPINSAINVPRVLDLERHLHADVWFEGELSERRVEDFVIFARTAANARDYLQPNHAIFCPTDRDDALMAITIAASAGIKMAALVLYGTVQPSANILALCRPVLESSGLPILYLSSNTWDLMRHMENFNRFAPVDDDVRWARTQEYFADAISGDWINAYLQEVRESVLSPASFRYQLVQRAIAANKVIVLPEGDEPRTVVAASQVAARKMARCVLLADPQSVQQVAESQGVVLGEGIEIIDPALVREKYVNRLVELRANKGMTEGRARDQLMDNVMLGTMMLEAGEVDGLVSGAVHTTANTMRPPLQIIKTAPGASMVSSVFFMCLPDKVMVYGDCAIVPKPSADELAQIAIQSNDTAKAFGIAPKVAMISYSTGSSGSGEDVEKVKAATEKVRALRPDILVDGPLQYDAAVVASVAASKAPDSPVAGQATVFVFPDLNTGNTTYKAVQRSANAISMGPVLQGMRKPVNDLSRGALVDDIVYTIAITAIQAAQND